MQKVKRWQAVKKILKSALLVLSFFIISCAENNADPDDDFTITTATNEIKARAFEFAKLYSESETEYEWGGQSPLRAIKIDCSGLVIMCYKYALVDTKYSLLKSDMTASYMHENASEPTNNPEQGDLIFMGEAGTDKITHIAIFDKEENDEIYFIDSTDNGIVNGVSERHYVKTDEKFKAFGSMKLKYQYR